MPLAEATTPEIQAQETKLAYFSILQYEPDHLRQERLNVAVLLEAPSYGYRGARFLRHMQSRVRDFDPTLSDKVIYEFAKNLERAFASEPTDSTYRPIGFSTAPRPEHLERLIGNWSNTAYTFWRFTDPKAVVIDAATQFTHELLALYRRLVQAKNAPNEELTKDKEYVRKAAIAAMQSRNLELTLNPPPVKGTFFLENEFDAAYQSGFASYLQFLSFDTATPSLDQAKAFITAKKDVGNRLGDKAVEYLAIVQPPESLRSVANREAYGRAIGYFNQAGIEQVRAEDAGFSLVADGIQGNHDNFRRVFAAP